MTAQEKDIKWKLPESPPRCVICGGRVAGPPFIASKPRRGTTIYAHTLCFKKEQETRKEDAST